MDALAHHLELLRVPCVERELKKQLRNDRIAHLRSIDADSQFVRATHLSCGSPPLFANLRCGVWYVPPSIRAGTCYFKSTDGHAGHWGFSLSRINLQAALAAGLHQSVMIVDSTRSGKRFPDALTKTVPIWCCVINRVLRNADGGKPDSGAKHSDPRPSWDGALWLPEWISPSEASQIESLVNKWVAALLRPTLAPVLELLRRYLHRPLRPIWCCPEHGVYDGRAEWHHGCAHGARASELAHCPLGRAACDRASESSARGKPEAGVAVCPGHYAVYCVSASAVRSAAISREHHSWTYIQGKSCR